MSRVYVQPPVPRCALHLYRHLLRESSYLPPVCRPFITERINTRFHKHRRDPDPTERLRQASHGLRYLRAANAGDMTRMRRILLLTFGRTGPRRRELLDRLVRKEPPTDSAALEQMMHAEASDEPDDWLAKWDVEKVEAFLKSQAHAGLHNSPRPLLKGSQLDLAEKIPSENAFGLPLHPRLARNKLKKAWKRVIDRALPPLTQGQWELLRDLATGELKGPEWAVPRRRPVAGRPKGKAAVIPREEQAWNWAPYTTSPVRHVERKNSWRMKLIAGTPDADGPLPGMQPAKLHNYTDRFWRRLYTQVWKLSAIMEKKPGGKGWAVKWGRIPPRLSPPAAVHGEFFHGVSEDGKRPRVPDTPDPVPENRRAE